MKNQFCRIITLAAVFSVQLASAEPPQIAAIVNRDTITIQDLEKELKGQSGSLSSDRQMVLSQTLNSLIVDKLVVARAASLDLSKDPAFLREKQDTLNQFVFGQMYQKYVASLVNVAPEDAEKYYYDNKEMVYKIPEQVRVSHILIEPEEDKTISDPQRRKQEADRVALPKAKEVKKRAQKEDFAALAQKFSKDYTTSMRGGDMGYQKRGDLLPEIEKAAFAAKPGDILGPFKSEYGYHVIKVGDRIKEGYRELDDKLKQEIENKLRTEKTTQRNRAFLDSLRNEMSYDFNDELLALPETTKVQNSTWCVVVNKSDTLRAGEIWEEILNYSLYTKSGRMSLGDKKDFLKNKALGVQLLVLELLARQLGYYDAPETKQMLRKFVQQRGEKIIRQQAVPQYNPSPEEIRQYFDSHPDQFKAEYPLHVYHIIFDDSLTASAVRDSILQGADFVEMAKKYYPGQGDVKDVAYDLGYLARHEMPEGFYEAADQLEIGGVSPPVKTFLGYHLIKLIDRKKDQTLQEVTPQITKVLKEEHQKKAEAEWEANLKKGAKIKIFQKNLDKIDLTRLNSGENPAGSDKP